MNRPLYAAYAAMFLACVTGHAQVTTGTIYGNIVDPSGAAVPAASVTATHQASGVSFQKSSDAAGDFAMPLLPVGEYTLVVTAPGFKTLRQSNVRLTAGQVLRTTLTLSLGSVDESITVTSEAPLVNTVNAQQDANVTITQLRELPLARRDWTQVLSLTTGAQGTAFNGLPGQGFRFTIDGTDAEGNAEFPSLAMYMGFNFIKVVSVEAISEVNIHKGVMSADVGNTMSGNINVITKSGTNELHGSLFLNNQVENLAARNQFLATKAPVVFNQFGGSVGGPLVRNRAFLFGVYEGYRQRAFVPISGNVPTQEFRDKAIAAVPAYKPFLERFPLPSYPVRPGDITGFYQGAASNSADDNHAVVRGDVYVNERNLFMVRYTRGRPGQEIPRVTTNTRFFEGVSEVGTLTYTLIRPAWTLENRVGYNLNDITREDVIYAQGVPGITCCLGFGDSGETLFMGGSTKSFESALAVTRGRHSLKAGGIFLRRLTGRENIETPAIQYANAEDFLANRPSLAQITFGNRLTDLRQWQLGAYIHDDFKFSRRLVINAGVRYDYTSVPKEASGRVFNRQSPFGELRPPNSMYNADFVNFSPRLGFAWTANSSGKTVIRGGAGVFHNSHNLFGGPVETVRNAVDEPGRYIFSRLEIEQFGLKYPITNAATLPLVKGRVFLPNTHINPNFPNPYSLLASLGIQQAILNDLVLETGYVGTRGVKLNLVREMNIVDRLSGQRPVPGGGQFRYYDTSDSSHYHSWQTSLRKRFANNFLFNVHHTWSSCIAYQEGSLSLPNQRVQDNDNIRLDRGPTVYDIRQRFVSDFLYELPLIRLAPSAGRRSRLLLGGWQFSGVLNAESGSPLYITQPSTYPGSRPDYVGGAPVLSNYRDTLQYLNPAAFAKVPIIAASGATARLGTLGRNAVRAPGSWVVDLALSKNFAFTEGWRLQVRADMFNAFNHTNLRGVSANINNANFGRLTSAVARVVQLNARLSF